MNAGGTAEMPQCVGELCMVLVEDEPDCPARIVARVGGGVECEHCGQKQGCVRVHYIGWSAMWDECVPLERIRPPSSRCARLMAEIDALKGLFLTPPTGHVRHNDDPASEGAKVAVGRVVDRAVRQVAVDGPMQVMYYLEHIRGSTKSYGDGWYAADGLQASSRLATGAHLAIDTTQRLGGGKEGAIRLRLVGEDLWVCLSDWVRFATRDALTTLPSLPVTVKDTFSAHKFGAGAVQAFPVSLFGCIMRCLPLEHSRRHRQSGDAEWLRSEIASELSVINCASVLRPRAVELPQRTETLRDVPGGKPKTIDVHVIPGAQPLIDASDFLRLVARQTKRFSFETVEDLVRSLVVSGASSDALTLGAKRVLPADLCALALDTLASSAVFNVSAVARFRSSSAWCWIRDQLADLTDDGAVRTSLAWQSSARAPSIAQDAVDSVDNDCGYEPVSWSLVESERGLERITQPIWSAEAESGLPKQKLRTKTDAKYVYAISEKDAYMKNGVNMDDIERALDATSGHRMEDFVGIGRITDEDHPVLRCHSGTASAFLLYAMRDLPAFTVVGEYAGDILTDVEVAERQQIMRDNKTDNYSMVIYETANRSKKSKGATIWTSDRTNELILANDWREDVLNPRHSGCDAADAPKRRQNLNPVEVISTADGKPHILYVVGEEPVKKGAELLIDYGEDYWMCFRSEHKWSQKLQVVDKALAREQKLRRELERRVEELKTAARNIVDVEVQTELQEQVVDMEIDTENSMPLRSPQQPLSLHPRLVPGDGHADTDRLDMRGGSALRRRGSPGRINRPAAGERLANDSTNIDAKVCTWIWYWAGARSEALDQCLPHSSSHSRPSSVSCNTMRWVNTSRAGRTGNGSDGLTRTQTCFSTSCLKQHINDLKKRSSVGRSVFLRRNSMRTCKRLLAVTLLADESKSALQTSNCDGKQNCQPQEKIVKMKCADTAVSLRKPKVHPAVAPPRGRETSNKASNTLIAKGQAGSSGTGTACDEDLKICTSDVQDNSPKNKRKRSNTEEPEKQGEKIPLRRSQNPLGVRDGNAGLQQGAGAEHNSLSVDDYDDGNDGVQIIAEKGRISVAIDIDAVAAVCVHFTGYSNSTTKDAHRSILQTLGVSVVEDALCSDLVGMRKATHVIAPAGVRNRKTVAALATQRWLLRDSWIEACAQAQSLVAEAEHGVRLSVATLEGASFFFESSYRKQHADGLHKASSLSKLIKFCGGTVVHMGRSDYLLVGDKHDAASATGATSLTLESFLKLATNGHQDQIRKERLHSQSPPGMYVPQAGRSPRSAAERSATLRDFFHGAATTGPSGLKIAAERTELSEQSNSSQPAKRKNVGWSKEEYERLATLMQQYSGLQPAQLRFDKIAQVLGTGRTANAVAEKCRRLKRTRVVDMDDAAKTDRSLAAFTRSKEGSDDLRLSLASCANAATPTTSVESHADGELIYPEGVAIGCFIRRRFNVGQSAMPKMFTGRLIKRCGGGAEWCMACKIRLVPDCAQHRVRYTDGDQVTHVSPSFASAASP